MGDLEKARRELRYAKSTADDRRWDQLEPKIKGIEAALEGVPEADAAPVRAELKTMKEAMEKGLREENSGRLEREIKRSLSAAADDLNRGYAESTHVKKAADRLASAEAQQWLLPDVIAKLQAEIAALSEKMAAGAKAETSSRLEREIQRSISAAAGELSRGYTESPALQRAADRLASSEARQGLLPAAAAKLQADITALQAKSGKPAAPPPAPAAAAPPPPPKPAAVSAAPPPPPPAARPTPSPAPSGGATEGKPAASVPGGDPDRTRSMEADIARTLRFAEDEFTNVPERAGQGAEKALLKLDSADAKTHLPPETIERLRAQANALKGKVDQAMLADKIRRIEERVERFLRQSESDLEHSMRNAVDMLRHARERLEMEDAKKYLAADSAKKFRAEIEKVQGKIAAKAKATALDHARPLLKELEERASKPLFEGSDPAWRVIGDLESLKSRVRGALSEVPADDADVKAVEQRIAKVDGVIATQSAKLGRDQAFEMLRKSVELDRDAIQGWEEETAEEYHLPRTALAIRRLSWFVNDKETARLRSEFKADQEIQSVIDGVVKALESATAKLHKAFEAAITALENKERPTNRIDLEQPSRLAGQASSDFEGTKHKDQNVRRASALYERWQAEIEADRARRQKKYDELSAVADAAWPAIEKSISAEEGFDPAEGGQGRTVLLKGIRNRIGWDFSGAHDFAIWVGVTPVVGNYDKTVSDAVAVACEKTGLGLDDHTDWDAVITIGGPSKVKQRFTITVRDRSNLEIGRVEEWRPVDCLKCTVIALRAGPVAVGPKK